MDLVARWWSAVALGLGGIPLQLPNVAEAGQPRSAVVYGGTSWLTGPEWSIAEMTDGPTKPTNAKRYGSVIGRAISRAEINVSTAFGSIATTR